MSRIAEASPKAGDLTFSVESHSALNRRRNAGGVRARKGHLITAPSSPSLDDMARAVSETLVSLMERLSLRSQDVARILGVSPSYMTKFRRGESRLTPDSYPYQNALLLIRTLDAVYGMLGTERDVAIFMRAPHKTLGKPPMELMTTPEGLVDVTRYVESFVH